MADLSFLKNDPTLDAIRHIAEEEAEKEPGRRYIGASSIGHDCARMIWYQRNGAPAEPIQSHGLFAIQDGHNTEYLICERMRTVPGIQLWTHKDDGSQYGFDYGHIKGHYDGIVLGLLQAPQTPHIFEVKCVNEKKFHELQKLSAEFGEKKALEKWDKTYYAQACVYMHAEKLTRHYLVCATPGGRDMTSVRTEANPTYAESLIEKAKRIEAATEPPERQWKKDFYLCKWCRYRGVCHE